MTSRAATRVAAPIEGHEWRTVPDWPEYEVSETGDVRRVLTGQGATVLAIRKMVAMRLPQTFIARGYGICRQSVGDIANRKRWRHL